MRTFIAIELPQELKEALGSLIASLDKGFSGVSWVRPDAIHLTIKFIGEADEKAVEGIVSELQATAKAHRPIEVSVEGVGGFPNLTVPRVVWAGVRENPALSALHADIDARLSSIGIMADDKPFRPHLTVCRVKEAASGRSLGRLADKVKPALKFRFTAGSFILYKSELGPKGARHTVVRRFDLPAAEY